VLSVDPYNSSLVRFCSNSSSLLLFRRAVADPGYGTRVLLPPPPSLPRLSRASIPGPTPLMPRWSRAKIPGPPPQTWRRSRAWIPSPPPLMLCWSRVLLFFPSHNGNKPPLEFVFPFLFIIYFSSYNSNNPLLEFVCPFLYILYFPHTMATTLPGICLSASLHSLLSSHKGENNPSYPLLKISKLLSC
jgi:hypothetical protein